MTGKQNRLTRERAALGAWAILLAFLARFAPAFFAAGNLRDILLGMAPVLLVAVGMTFVIVAGQIDISVGSQFAVCSVAAGAMAAAGSPMLVVVLLTCGSGVVLGSINGALVTWLSVPSIVATLAMMVTAREALRLGTGGAWVENLPPTFQWFGFGQSAGRITILLVACVVFAAAYWASRNLAAVRAIYAAGSDPEAARLSGIPTPRVLRSVFALMGGLAGLAAVLNAVRFSDLQSNTGVGLELKAIAAVVVGGASITGGRGTLTGTLIGVGLLGSIGPALTFLGVDPAWEKALQGAIILTALLAEAAVARAVKHA